MAASEIKTIAELPSREELVAKLLFVMQSPMRRLVTVLNGPVRNLAGVMSQIADQKSKSGPAERKRRPRKLKYAFVEAFRKLRKAEER